MTSMTPFMKQCDEFAEEVYSLESDSDMKWMTLIKGKDR